MGSDVPSTGCNFSEFPHASTLVRRAQVATLTPVWPHPVADWNATVKISSDAENIRCECSP